MREFAFVLGRTIVVDSVRVRGTATASLVEKDTPPTTKLQHVKASPKQADPKETQKLYVDGDWKDAAILRLSEVPKGTVVDGPALILDSTQTILVKPQFRAYILAAHVVIEKVDHQVRRKETAEDELSPIQLSVFAHRFMAIAEQMGNTLQRTAISTSIRERLDFSCAIFSPDGQLVANAPHIPMVGPFLRLDVCVA